LDCRKKKTGARGSLLRIVLLATAPAVLKRKKEAQFSPEAAGRCALDKILIKDLLVRCIIGVTDEERREKQDVVINLALSADLAAAGQHDRLDESINYRSIKKQILAVVEPSTYHLVEALAERIAAECLKEARVREVEVTVEKPSALRFARTVGVQIARRRP
jgi:dihydroneopterin aldolase/D-erythro-7,8-dihydroneopterin triphosphate epimerase